EDSATWDSNGKWWLKSPNSDPSKNMVVVPRSQPTRRRQARQEVMHVLGRRDPVVVDYGRTDWQGEIAFRLDTKDEQDALDALLELDEPLLLQAPNGEAWEDTWLVLGDQERQRVID